jgi:hypothetical protein
MTPAYPARSNSFAQATGATRVLWHNVLIDVLAAMVCSGRAPVGSGRQSRGVTTPLTLEHEPALLAAARAGHHAAFTALMARTGGRYTCTAAIAAVGLAVIATGLRNAT